MADVTVKYKDTAIAELSESGTKTLKTGGKYCEGDVTVEYAKPTGGGQFADIICEVAGNSNVSSNWSPSVTAVEEQAE